MSRRRTRVRAAGGSTARPVAAGAAPGGGRSAPPAVEVLPDADAREAQHRRAVEIRNYRMGIGPRPAGFDQPRERVAADGLISVTFPVEGMTCRSCEVRIGRHVGKLPGVERVSASATRGSVTVESAERISAAAVEQAINRAGYTVGRTPWLATDPRVWATAGAGIVLVAILAVIAQLTGFERIAGGTGDLETGGLVVALLLGLAAGVSTCMALVGGLVLGLSAAYAPAASASRAAPLRPTLVLVAGRIGGYVVLGGLLGAVGATVAMPPQLTAVLMLAAAVAMTLLGARLTGVSPRLAGWTPTLPLGIGARLGLVGEGRQAYSDRRAAVLGAATFFLPCGFTQAIQIYALSTGSPLLGAALLGTFALGTAPGLLAVSGLPLVVPARAKPTLTRLVGVAVLGFAFVNGSAGWRLTGIELPSLVGIVSAAPLPGTLGSDGVQRITTYQEFDGYSPGNVVIYAGYPTIWTVESRAVGSCAASLWIPGLDIRARLVKGPNTFELPPLPPGRLTYTCAMGMYGAKITVVEAPADLPSGGG